LFYYNIYILQFIIYNYSNLINILPQSLLHFIHTIFITSQDFYSWGCIVILCYILYNNIFAEVRDLNPHAAVNIFFVITFAISLMMGHRPILAETCGYILWIKVVLDCVYYTSGHKVSRDGRCQSRDTKELLPNTMHITRLEPKTSSINRIRYQRPKCGRSLFQKATVEVREPEMPFQSLNWPTVISEWSVGVCLASGSHVFLRVIKMDMEAKAVRVQRFISL
jgi:hypothetical protein